MIGIILAPSALDLGLLAMILYDHGYDVKMHLVVGSPHP